MLTARDRGATVHIVKAMPEATSHALTSLDHITVAANSLDQGLEHVWTSLRIDMPYGGTHPRMGTHNHVLRLGESVFLEVIAVDPTATAPVRPRWFQLDDPRLQAELRLAPRLVTWVVRTTRIGEAFLASSRPLGAIEPIQRSDLRWLITFPDDGSLIDGGMIPSLIQWPTGVHPASRMPDLGCTLERLEAAHPDPEGYLRDLASIGADRHIEVRQIPPGSRPHLVAHIRTPDGVRTLR